MVEMNEQNWTSAGFRVTFVHLLNLKRNGEDDHGFSPPYKILPCGSKSRETKNNSKQRCDCSVGSDASCISLAIF